MGAGFERDDERGGAEVDAGCDGGCQGCRFGVRVPSTCVVAGDDRPVGADDGRTDDRGGPALAAAGFDNVNRLISG